MSYEVHGQTGWAARIQGLSTPWKVALGAGALLLLASAMGGDDDAALPSAIRPGAKLAGLQLQGEKAMYHEHGIEVTDVNGEWVEVRFGEDDKTRRWFHFTYVAGFKLKAD